MRHRLKLAILGATVLSLSGALLVAAWRTPDSTDAVQPSPPAVTPLPDLSFLVRADDRYRMLEVTSGWLGRDIGLEAWDDHLFGLSDGRLLCICTDREVEGSQERLTVDVRWLSPTGDPLDEFAVGVYRGDHDPDVPMGAALDAIFDPDSDTVYLSSLQRQAQAWRLAIDVVSLAARRVVQTVELEPVALVAESSRSTEPVYAWAPTLDVAPDGRTLVIQQTSVHRSQITETRFWSASLKGGRIGPLVAWPSDPGSLGECGPGWSGFASGAAYFAICPGWGGDARWLRRVDLAGVPMPDVELGVPVSTFAVDQERGALFTWDPFAKAMARVDLASGEVVTAHAGEGGLLERLTSRMVPRARAKMMLEPGLVLAPDGSRLYAASVEPSEIWVLDARTLEVIDRWPLSGMPNSVALAGDGSLLFVSTTIVEADGAENTLRGSIAVVDLVDGSFLYVADVLGGQLLTFVPELMPAMP